MKRLLAAALLCLSGPVLALTPQEACKKISAMAGDAMQARQDGDLMEDAMESVGDQSKFSNAMVARAYEVEVAKGSAAKKKAVSDFRNEAYGECYRNLIEPAK